MHIIIEYSKYLDFILFYVYKILDFFKIFDYNDTKAVF